MRRYPFSLRWPEVESTEQCFALAAQARSAAETEVLANVRQKHLAAAKAWELLATQISRLTEARQQRQIAEGKAI
jgi:hypothetical protein